MCCIIGAKRKFSAKREKSLYTCLPICACRYILVVFVQCSVRSKEHNNNKNLQRKKNDFIFSGIENKNDIYTCDQLEASTPGLKEGGEVKSEIISETPNAAAASKAYSLTTIPIKEAPRTTALIKEHRPRSVTASVFVPVTEIPTALLELQQQLTRYQHHQAASTVTTSVFSPISSTSSSLSTHRQSLYKQQIAARATTKKSQASATPETMNKGYMMFLAEGSDLSSKYPVFFPPPMKF